MSKLLEKMQSVYKRVREDTDDKIKLLLDMVDIYKTVEGLEVENERLTHALKRANVHMGILVGRMKGCNEITGMHELMDEAEDFLRECKEALTTQKGGGL